MKRACLAVIAVIAVMAASGSARAQPEQPDHRGEPAACVSVDTTPGALLEPPPASDELETPIPWTEFAVEGGFIEPSAKLHALLEPTLAQYRTSLSAKTLRDVAKLIAKLGYQLVSHNTRPDKAGILLVLRVEPLPMIRKVDVDVDQGILDRLVDEEIRRRMLLRTGAYLPSEETRRKCALVEERKRIEDYLHDEGYADANVTITAGGGDEKHGTKLVVRITLGDKYRLETPNVVQPPGFVAVTTAEIQAQFAHRQRCLLSVCVGSDGFTRAQHLEDLQKVRDLFHKRGYPAARVQSNFDPKTSFIRQPKHVVRVTITTDPRRRLDLRFEGVSHEAVADDQLRKHMTFEDSGSTDDVEIAASARSLQTYLQQRGRFDARVTWQRERLDDFDRVTFHIDQGPTREVNQVQFVCNGQDCERGRKPFDAETLSGIVATKIEDLKGDILGTNVAATSPELATDVDRIREAYRRAGYRDAEVSVMASPIELPRPGLPPPSSALAAALVEQQEGDGLHVRFTIDEGTPTLLARVEFEPGDDGARQALASGLCDGLLRELTNELAPTDTSNRVKQLGARVEKQRCVAIAAQVPFREDDVALTKDKLRDFLFRQGRPRAEIQYEARVLAPHVIEAHFKLNSVGERRLGQVVIRGNFKTADSVVEYLLDLHSGQLLTSDALAKAARELRKTGLFDAVNIDLVDKDTPSGDVNAVVHVEERYDYKVQFNVEGGYSSYNGFFGTLSWLQNNLWGYGASLVMSGTYGEKITDLESTLRFPRWLTHIGAQADVTGAYRQQDTPRFGLLTTESVGTGLTWLFPRPWSPTSAAQNRTIGFHYDYRLRTRNVDTLRPIGSDMDDPQVAVSTQTGSISLIAELDQRVDRRGQLSPLAPEGGFRLFASAAYALPSSVPLVGGLIGGQDTFLKLTASGSVFQAFSENLVVRADLRYDEGIPLGGAALLPEVERFFAGGDNTVRGYDDDKLATEIIQVGVPPIANVSQIRVIPAGGNIRLLSSIDAQYRIYKILAAAAFTDAGMIANDWKLVTVRDIRPSVGMGVRVLSPFGILGIEYAVPIVPHLGDDPRGRWHVYFAARAQF